MMFFFFFFFNDTATTEIYTLSLHDALPILGNEVPEIPVVFAKFSTSVVGPDAEVPYPPDTEDLHFEGELAVVIGRECTRVSAAEGADVEFGRAACRERV